MLSRVISETHGTPHQENYYSEDERSSSSEDFTFDKASASLTRHNSVEEISPPLPNVYELTGIDERILFVFPSSWIIIPHGNRFLEAWDLLIDSASLFTVFWTPYVLAFLKETGDIVLDIPMTLLFSADCILHFFRAYPLPDHPGSSWFETRPNTIAMNYLRGWFLVDFLCAAPLDRIMSWVCDQLDVRRDMYIIAFMRLLRLLRLFRLAKIQRHLAQLRDVSGMRVANFKLCGLAFSTIVACHWIACLWGSIGQGWVEHEETWMDNFDWLSRKNPRVPLEMYLVSFYWACVTLTSIGYGDITPGTDVEYIICAAIMCLGSSVWAYVIGAICGIIADMDPQTSYFEEHMDALNTALRENGVPKSLQWKSREYLQASRPVVQQTSQEDVFRELSPALRGEVQIHCMRDWLGEKAQVKWIRALNFEIKVAMAEAAVQTLYAPLQIVEVIGAGDEPAMFFLRRGMVWKKGKCMKSGAVWGEDIILNNPLLHDKTMARAFLYSEVFALTKHSLDSLRLASPREWSVIRPFQVRMAARRGIIVEAERMKKSTTTFDWLERSRGTSEGRRSRNESRGHLDSSHDDHEHSINSQLAHLMSHIDDRFANLQERVARIESSLHR